MMENLRIVLVRPKYSRNVGMVARAMANYGLTKLILIEPQCDMGQEAHEGAAGGQGPLQNISIYPHWQRFYDWEHEGIRVAFSAREGRSRETFDFAAALETTDTGLLTEMQNKATYFIFGPEDHGLSDEDLNFVHRIFHIKLPGSVTSMNLSHAVLNALTLVHAAVNKHKIVIAGTSDVDSEKIFFPEQTLRKWLEALHVDISSPKVNAYSVLKKLVLKSFPTTKELKIFETVLQQTIRKLKSEKNPEVETENDPNQSKFLDI